MARPVSAAYGPFEKAWGTGSFAHLVLRQQVSFRYGLISMTSVRNAVRRFLIYLIRCYRQLRPNRAPCCRYSPSCSEYAVQAITTHGSVKGVLLASWRILRCNPFSNGGYDPVPPKGSWRNKAE